MKRNGKQGKLKRQQSALKRLEMQIKTEYNPDNSIWLIQKLKSKGVK